MPLDSGDKRVDAYIAKAPEFARPILEKVRRLFHQACPEVVEDIKWGVPHFSWKGMLGGMAAFKQHVGYGFWKAKLMSDPAGLFETDCAGSMCTVKPRSMKDLPADKVLLAYIREAMKLNEQGVKAPRKPVSKRSVAPPADLAAALKKSKSARATFEAFSPSHQREYNEWIEEAKRPETRQRRVEQAIEMLAEGKSKNWKYERKK